MGLFDPDPCADFFAHIPHEPHEWCGDLGDEGYECPGIPAREENTANSETPTIKEKPMNKLAIAKNAASSIVGMGVGKIVKDVIANNTNPEKLTDKVSIYAGSAVLAMMAKDAVKPYVSAKIDRYAARYNELQAKVKEDLSDSSESSPEQ